MHTHAIVRGVSAELCVAGGISLPSRLPFLEEQQEEPRRGPIVVLMFFLPVVVLFAHIILPLS